MTSDEEFELVPVAPMRRLERRLEKIEGMQGVDVKEFFSQLVDIVRMNQQLVDELAKANDALRIEISKLPGKLDELINDLNELLAFIKASAGAEAGEASAGMNLEPLLKKMDALIEGNKKIVESNELMMDSIDSLSSKMRKPIKPYSGSRLPPLKRR
jgi:hypothetical protein